MRNYLFLTAGLLVICGTAAAADDPLNGKWKIDAPKSSWSDGKFPKNMSITMDLKVTADQMVYHSENDTDKSKKPSLVDYTAKMDWKQYPLTGPARYNMVSIRRIGKNQLEVLEWKDNDAIVYAIWEVLPGGKRFVRRGMAKGVDGSAHEYEEFFDKQ